MNKPKKAGSKPAKSSQESKKRGPGKPFQKNDPITGEVDPRINRDGAARRFDQLRELVLNILNEDLELKKDGAVIGKMKQVESVIRQWILSGDGFKQNRAIEIGYGKVPDEIKYSFDMEGFIRNNISVFTDGQLSRMAKGEDPMIVLSEVLQDAQELLKKKEAK